MKLAYQIYPHIIGQVLTIEEYIVDVYPVSYTIEECLEEFCEKVKWELDRFRERECTRGALWVNTNCKVHYRRTLRDAVRVCRREHSL